jgi:hypothetical protein
MRVGRFLSVVSHIGWTIGGLFIIAMSLGGLIPAK